MTEQDCKVKPLLPYIYQISNAHTRIPVLHSNPSGKLTK